MTKKLFIVNDESGIKVINNRTMYKVIREQFNSETENVNRKDIESLANDIVDKNSGTSMSSEDFNTILSKVVNILVEYSVLTPFKFMELKEKIDKNAL